MTIDAGEHDGETVRQVGIGPKLSDTPGSVRALGATTPGQHTDAILAELGYDADCIAALREDGAVG